jgi:hypothetical protein
MLSCCVDIKANGNQLALSSGWRWPPAGGRPSASKLYGLKVSSRQVPLREAQARPTHQMQTHSVTAVSPGC